MFPKLWILAVQLALVHGGGDVSYLYGEDNLPVKEFTGATNVFLKSKKPRVVEFYSPHCVSILNRMLGVSVSLSN
jgi:hypothetical protein